LAQLKRDLGGRAIDLQEITLGGARGLSCYVNDIPADFQQFNRANGKIASSGRMVCLPWGW
jgi:hypothetical protein